MQRTEILVVDDEKETRELLKEFLSRQGFVVSVAGGGQRAIDLLREKDFDLMLVDLKMPRVDGFEVLKEIGQLGRRTLAIAMTGFGSTQTAAEVMGAGAYDFVTKPFHLQELKKLMLRALEEKRWRGASGPYPGAERRTHFRRYEDQKLFIENLALRRQLQRKYRFENMIGDSPEMQQVFALIEKVADSDSTVLICGKSGTGKELVARALHFNSHRKDRPLIPVNCGAIPEALLESELFGHEKGAFTGASATRIGRFELAHQGTIFLDEIGDMSPALQVKVLRVLQEQEFERIGGTKTIKVDVRIIAATNQDLEQAVANRTFREDLYYRLNVIPILLPPLRRRQGDIPLLINHFLERFNREKNKHILGITDEAIKYLMNYDWPGNVRELENLIERLVILKEAGTIEIEDLPKKFFGARSDGNFPQFDIPDQGISLKEVVDRFENQIILRALEKSDWVKNKAARLLGMNRTTLVEKLKKKHLAQPLSKS
ncbi:MAG: sigma-54-dependent Fis family transcriptional regulator [Candidatus Tectomicrobia bacterium]|uniref:Sigma-54-dependent Fis family transcriptional regulator n=1 Tax=Tectimicrobiota bacterium TaxID=2528274 RepID=A0A932LZN4_UNCTE|nr:sigma-54-dependent Fis family transcriptional regulator [Candidatus Tectomicrobia bacterium]